LLCLFLESWVSQFLILATGSLSQANIPDYPGIKDFKGKVVMTTNWDKNTEYKGIK
jgi:cation diffusion facilitator CzcD-associated flavoprotein CzcO